MPRKNQIYELLKDMTPPNLQELIKIIEDLSKELKNLPKLNSALLTSNDLFDLYLYVRKLYELRHIGWNEFRDFLSSLLATDFTGTLWSISFDGKWYFWDPFKGTWKTDCPPQELYLYGSLIDRIQKLISGGFWEPIK